MAAFQDKTSRRATEVEESEEVAAVVFLASIAAILHSGDHLSICLVQQVLSCGIAEETREGAVYVLILGTS